MKARLSGRFCHVLRIAGSVILGAMLSGTTVLAAATAPKPMLPFVENRGQFPESIRFVARDSRAWVGVSGSGIHYVLGQDEGTLTEFLGEEGKSMVPTGLAPAVTRVSDFRGADSAKWHRDLPTYASIGLGRVFPGVEVELLHGRQGVEKVFRVQPGASVGDIAIGYAQPHRLRVEKDGSLVVALDGSARNVRFSPPVAYQVVSGKRRNVAVNYRLREDGGYGFQVAGYRKDLPLVIDPSLVAATFLGGDAFDEVSKVLVESNGNVVVAGRTQVPGTTQLVPFPTVAGGFDPAMNGASGTHDVFIARLDPNLGTMLNMTFLGSSLDDYVTAIRRMSDGTFYVAGFTGNNPSFPTSASAYQRTGPRTSGGFVTHLSADLSTLIASTVFDVGPYTHNDFQDMTVDAAGNVFAVGGIGGGGFPVVPGYNTSQSSLGGGDVLVVKFDGALTQLLGATRVGGAAAEWGRAIAVDGSGRVYLTGEVAPIDYPTYKPLRYDFPTTAGSFMPVGTGCNASYVARLDNTLTQLQAGTLIGVKGSSEIRCGYSDSYGNVATKDILVTPQGKVYVAGDVESVGLPITGGVQPIFGKANNSHHGMPFVVRFDADLAKVEVATHFGGTNWYDSAIELAQFPDGRLVLAGRSGSTNFPTSIDAYESRLNQGVYGYDTYDAFVAVFNADLNRLGYATLIGGTRGDWLNGVAVGNDNDLYLAGYTQGVWDPVQNFPTTEGALDRTLPDWGLDGFVARLKIPEVLAVAVSGTGQMIPGTESDFEVRYRSSMRTTATDVVVTVDLLQGFEFAGASQGGQYLSNGQCTNRMFWRLGNLPAGTEGTLRFRVRVPAGAPNGDYPITARISAANAPDKPFDVAPYAGFSDVQVASTAYLTPGEALTARSANPALGALYNYAVANGYGYAGTATRVTFTDSQQSLRYQMVSKTDGAPAVLTFTTDRALVEVFRGKTYLLFDQNGGLAWNRSLGSVEFSGTWADLYLEGSASPAGAKLLPRTVKMGRCNFNCMINLIPEMTLGKISQIYSMLSFSIDCIKCAQAMKNGQTDEASVLENCSKCGASAAELVDAERVVSKIPGIGDAATIVLKLRECVNDCAANPDKHVCTQDRFDCSCFGNWLLGGVCKTECNKTTGTYAPISKTLFCTANEMCDAASCNSTGYESCCRKETDICPAGTKSCNKKTLRTRAAHDPNAKLSDKTGATLAGSRVAYTLQYENTGTGDALDVFVVDKLSASFDGATLAIQNGGTYDAASRVLQWNIGTLTAGQKGEVAFSVALRGDLAPGTEVTNQAEVYFPSALEITPTNLVVHVIKTVAAHQQTVAAVAGVAKALTLSGEGPSTLAYELLGLPAYGTLTGTAPALTYTPDASFSGVDHLTFRVTSGGQASAPATVTLEVAPSATDTISPTVVSVYPESGATGVAISGEQLPDGSYLPAIEAVFSEPVDAATVTTASFFITGVAGKVSYDTATRTARLYPTAKLLPLNTYTVTVSGVKDLKGNAMMSLISWQFTTVDGPFTSNVRTMVSSYYQTILGRVPDQPGLDFWAGEANRVVQLGADVREVFFAMSIAFFSSPEYMNRNTSDTQFLTDMYRTFFNRDPDAGGLAYWQGELSAIQSRSALLNSFLFSAEFTNTMTALFGTGSVRPEVDMTIDLYRGGFGRLPDSGGFAYWLGEIRKAQCQGGAAVSAAVTNLAGLFFTSAEYNARTRNDRDFLGDVYNAYMRRGPGGDAAGFNYWVGQVPVLGREGVRAQFVPSTEFQNRVTAVVNAGCYSGN